jgi:hypothetical protein
MAAQRKESRMSPLEALQDVRYLKVKGKSYAVVDADEWEELISRLEDLEDQIAVKEVYAELDRAGGDKRKAGWKSLDEFEKELSSERVQSRHLSASTKGTKKSARPRAKPGPARVQGTPR